MFKITDIVPKQCQYCIYTIKHQGAYYILPLTLKVLVIFGINVKGSCYLLLTLKVLVIYCY